MSRHFEQSIADQESIKYQLEENREIPEEEMDLDTNLELLRRFTLREELNSNQVDRLRFFFQILKELSGEKIAKEKEAIAKKLKAELELAKNDEIMKTIIQNITKTLDDHIKFTLENVSQTASHLASDLEKIFNEETRADLNEAFSSCLMSHEEEIKDKRYFWLVQEGRLNILPSYQEQITELKKFDEEKREELGDFLSNSGMGKLLKKYIETVYYDTPKPFPPEYGIAGYSGGVYYSHGDLGQIKLQTLDQSNWGWILAHELGHSLHPLISENFIPGIPLLKQAELGRKFHEIRRTNPQNITWYVDKINNANPIEEARLKEQEDWAESFAFYLTNPKTLQKISPDRYDFWKNWFKEFASEFNPKKFRQENSRLVKKYFEKQEH